MKSMEKSSFTRINGFQDNIADGRPNQWRCRAGARYLYICEDGLVHYCSQQRGYPGIPLEKYTKQDIRREYLSEKPVLPIARFPAYTRYPFLTPGALRSFPRPRQSPRREAAWSRSSELNSGRLCGAGALARVV